MMHKCTTSVLNIYIIIDSLFIFLCFQTPPRRRVVRRWNLARRRVTTMSRTSVGFYVYRVRRYENNDIFLQLRPCTPRCLLRWRHLRQWVGRSVGRPYAVSANRPTITGGLAQWTGWPLRVGRWSQQAGTAMCCVSAKENIRHFCLWSQPLYPLRIRHRIVWHY